MPGQVAGAPAVSGAPRSGPAVTGAGQRPVHGGPGAKPGGGQMMYPQYAAAAGSGGVPSECLAGF